MVASISDIMKVMLMFDSSAAWDDLKPSPLLNATYNCFGTVLDSFTLL